MTIEEYLGIKEGMDNAQNSTVPFPVVQDDKLVVSGDVNKTEINKSTFTITFRVPQKDENGNVKYRFVSKEYKDVFITPRQDVKIIELMTKLMPFFRKVEEDGTIGDYTNEEQIEIIASVGDEIWDRMYDLVAGMLGVDEQVKPMMEVASVLEATSIIISNYTEVVNEADVSFPNDRNAVARRKD